MANKTSWIVGRMGPQQKARARGRLAQVCAGCGATADLTLDHKVARAWGGTNHISNLQMLCRPCNAAKCRLEQRNLPPVSRRSTGLVGEQLPHSPNATLYRPSQPAQVVAVAAPGLVPELLGCAPGRVAVLSCSPEYVAYAVLDCEAETNEAAMAAVAEVSGGELDPEDQDHPLRGAVLLVRWSGGL